MSTTTARAHLRRLLSAIAITLATASTAVAVTVQPASATPMSSLTQVQPAATDALLAAMNKAGAKPTGHVSTQSVPGPIAGCVGSKSMSGATNAYGDVQVFFTFVTDCRAATGAVTAVGGQVTGSYCYHGVNGSGCTQLSGWESYYIAGKYVTYTSVLTCYTGNWGSCSPTGVYAVHSAVYYNQTNSWND